MTKPPFDPNASLEELLAKARARFGELVFDQVEIGGAPLDILQVKDMPAYIDKLLARAGAGKKVDLPLWAKVWPTNVVLSMFLGKYPFPQDFEFLEIGAGVGLAGLVLARRGYAVTITDIEPDALLFSRINALRNGLADKVDIRIADFTKDRLGRRYDVILGCEILFRKSFFEPLGLFLGEHLSDRAEAEIVLGSDGARQGLDFFKKAAETYAMMRKDVEYADMECDEQKTACLYRLRRKQ
ncbi:class I SAM-dependent methyltransferase [Paucidesulfovibrio longus]|uniref:class I SAM-dependent methyltransferase n=1 Tax=Paucidesulfovibrio longus TaxID=889 RepID=UPI0003B451DF|nr:methyltransferase [Paucidesulfovibrio longus]